LWWCGKTHDRSSQRERETHLLLLIWAHFNKAAPRHISMRAPCDSTSASQLKNHFVMSLIIPTCQFRKELKIMITKAGCSEKQKRYMEGGPCIMWSFVFNPQASDGAYVNIPTCWTHLFMKIWENFFLRANKCTGDALIERHSKAHRILCGSAHHTIIIRAANFLCQLRRRRNLRKTRSLSIPLLGPQKFGRPDELGACNFLPRRGR
jgi:hypothetical protein